jgi:hypothetical protein
VLQTNAPPTLDVLFRRVLAWQPDALALIDPPDKLRITGRRPLRLTYAEADRAISALAAHFAGSGLPANSVLGVQLPNTVEFALTVLAAHRAGLVVALLPQLFRHADLTAALNRTGARAIVAASRIDGVDHADLAMNAAAEAFSIRHVCGFGDDLPEGMASLDVAMSDKALIPPAVAQEARRAAVITFDTTPDGVRAIPRTHLHLIAGGLAVFLESAMPSGAAMLSAQAPTSFAGLSASITTWLLSGGTLALHHPFDDGVLERQIAEHGCETLVVPAPLALKLAETGMLERTPGLTNVIGLWRAPEQVAASASWTGRSANFTDLYLLGEAGLFGAQRSLAGTPAPIMPGPFTAPRNQAGASAAGELLITPRGTLGLRGPMVTIAAYAPLPPRHSSVPALPAPDFVDTGFAARLDKTTGALCITAPPSGIMTVGGYRFRAQDLQDWAARLGQGALLTALPDRLSGYRLAGRAQDNARAREALSELGLNPLMVEAFRDAPGRTDETRG